VIMSTVGMSTVDTTGTGQTGNVGGVRVVNLERAPLKELLTRESTRSCNNVPMILFFWAHLLGMLSLIIYVMTHEANATTSNFLKDIVAFVAQDETGQKLFGVMIGTCITGGVFSMCWIWFLRYFKDDSIKVSIVIAHLIVAGLAIWAIISNIIIFVVLYGLGLAMIDLWLYCNRQDFPFSEVMMKVGTKCVSENPKMQCFAYAFMPLQIVTYIVWLMGMLYCFAFDWGINNWYVICLLFIFSYNWTGWFWHLMVHSFVTVLSSFWALGMEGGYDKASESCKASMTYAQGPIAVGSFIMAWLSILRAMIRYALRGMCCCCGDVVYKFLCNCLQTIIQRYNEYVLAIGNLFDIGFFDASKTLVALFKRTGMSFITNEVAWSVPISVGTFVGYCVSGGLGLGYHKIAFADDETLSSTVFDSCFFFVYAALGGSVASIGLAPMRSALTAIFVIWAEEPKSFAAGQPELYGDLLEAVNNSPGVKGAIEDALLQGNMQAEV